MKHVSESRVRSKTGRTSCRQALLEGNFPQIDAGVLTAAMSASRVERREARRNGRSNVLATRPAE
eukprot:3841401-Karenia_brevis.AAC.1